MINRNTVKKTILTIFMYVSCLAIGLAIIIAVQYNLHKDLMNNAERAAREYSDLEELEEGFRYMNIHIYVSDLESGSITEIGGQDSEQSRQYRQFAVRYREKWGNRSESEYTIACSFYPLTFAAVASTPVNKTNSSRVYVVRAIRYMTSLVQTFIFILTVMYAGLIICILIWARSKHRVDEIYSTYIANVSHELKTPIASIQAILETLDEGLVTGEADRSRYYGMMHREADHLQHTVQEIIELSKVQDKRKDTSKTTVSLHEILDELINVYSERCEELDVSLEVLADLDRQPLLNTNRDCMQLILRIILDNAVKFVDEEGHISIDISNSANYSTIAVSDNGMGISAKDMPHIFDRFYKSTDRRNKSGTGLGLAIAKALTDELGEKITAESKLGQGSTFYVTIHHLKEK